MLILSVCALASAITLPKASVKWAWLCVWPLVAMAVRARCSSMNRPVKRLWLNWPLRTSLTAWLPSLR